MAISTLSKSADRSVQPDGGGNTDVKRQRYGPLSANSCDAGVEDTPALPGIWERRDQAVRRRTKKPTSGTVGHAARMRAGCRLRLGQLLFDRLCTFWRRRSEPLHGVAEQAHRRGNLRD
jgi:hypothetical protein